MTSEWRLESGEPCEYPDGELLQAKGAAGAKAVWQAGLGHTENAPGAGLGSEGSLVSSRGGERGSAGLSWRDPEAHVSIEASCYSRRPCLPV